MNQPGWGPQGYPPPGYAPPPKKRSGCLTGCLVVGGIGLLIGGVCGVGLFLGYQSSQDGVDVVRTQARALGRGDAAAACALNAPRALPCPQYVANIQSSAPWFPGSGIELRGFNANADAVSGSTLRLDLKATGAQGDHTFTAVLARVNDAWRVQSLEFEGAQPAQSAPAVPPTPTPSAPADPTQPAIPPTPTPSAPADPSQPAIPPTPTPPMPGEAAPPPTAGNPPGLQPIPAPTAPSPGQDPNEGEAPAAE